MKQTRFVKLAGCGNDFILVDARKKGLSGNPSRLARSWCDRRRGIGADGLLLTLPSRKADARMRIFNSDGSEAEMCGNGLRCMVWYLHSHNGRHWPESRGEASSSRSHREITVDTRAGLMRAEVISSDRVRVFLSRPKNLHLGQKLKAAGKSCQVHSVNSGVPHAVLLTSRLEKTDLSTLGPAIRHHKAFKPAGTNVNLMRIESPHRIEIRTFERGVEGETLACGTGAVAAVLIGTALGRLQPPVQVKTAGGESLRVGFTQNRKPWEDLYLEGPVRTLFEGGVPR